MRSYVLWLGYHRSGGCDERDTVEVRSDGVDLMSYIKGCDVLNCEWDVPCSAYDVIHIVSVMSYIHLL